MFDFMIDVFAEISHGTFKNPGSIWLLREKLIKRLVIKNKTEARFLGFLTIEISLHCIDHLHWRWTPFFQIQVEPVSDTIIRSQHHGGKGMDNVPGRWLGKYMIAKGYTENVSGEGLIQLYCPSKIGKCDGSLKRNGFGDAEPYDGL